MVTSLRMKRCHSCVAPTTLRKRTLAFVVGGEDIEFTGLGRLVEGSGVWNASVNSGILR